MVRVNSCCYVANLRAGARNIAIISMGYDLLMMAALLLVLLLYVPKLPWMDDPEPRIEIYQILLIVSITIRSLHLIPSFILLYSTWGQNSRGVTFWLFLAVLDVILHLTWTGVPFLMKWPLDKTAIFVSLLVFAIMVILYFIACISSYGAWVRERHLDLKAKRRLKEDY